MAGLDLSEFAPDQGRINARGGLSLGELLYPNYFAPRTGNEFDTPTPPPDIDPNDIEGSFKRATGSDFRAAVASRAPGWALPDGPITVDTLRSSFVPAGHLESIRNQGDALGGLPVLALAAGTAAFGGGFSMPSGVEGLSAFEAPSFSGTFNPTLPGAVEGAGAAAAGVDGLTPLQAALQNPPPVGGSLTGSYSTMGYSTGLQSVPAMSYAEGVLGGGVPSATLPVESAGLLDGLWDKTKSVFSDPTARTGLQAAQMGAKLLGDDGDAQAKQQSSQAGFYSSLASLISAALASRQGGSSGGSSTPAFNSTYNASQAVAPDQRSSFLYGSSGGPSTQAYTMEKGAPTAIPALGGSATGGTPTAPTMPSQEQGAIRMRRKMYA